MSFGLPAVKTVHQSIKLSHALEIKSVQDLDDDVFEARYFGVF